MQLPGESIGIIADDLTGACDTALQFHLEGGNTRILLDTTAVTQAARTQTWLVNTDSRHLDSLDAATSARKSVRFLHQQIKLERFYKKIDSTLRGHIAQESLAILDELHWQAAIIAPAYPDQGRRTVGGYQIIRGVPVGQTETALDPLFPVRQSHLPTLMAQTAGDENLVGYIPLSKVMDGAGPILMAIQEQIQQSRKLIVVDACTDTDLEQLSLAINKLPSDMNVLPCGSAGLAKALSRKWVLHRDKTVNRPSVVIEKNPVLLVMGTASQTTRRQVEMLIQNFHDFLPDQELEMIVFNPAQVLGLDPVEHEVERIVQALHQNKNVLISTSYFEDSLTKTLIMAEEQNLSPNEASAKATDLLAEMTAEILSRASAKLLLSGGETANAVCKAIGTRTLQIIEQVEQSIPLMIDEHARWIITKSGGFGDDMSLLNIFKNLKNMELEEEEAQHV